MACWCAGQCPHVGKAQAFLNQKQPHRARAVLRNALCSAPFCVEGNIMLAQLLCQFNHSDYAMGHIDRAAQQADPGRIHFERAKVYRSQLKLAEAREEFYAALQANPESEMVAASFVGALEMAGLFKEGLEVCDAARKKFPAYPDLRRLDAVIHDAMGDTAGALAILQGPELSPVEYLDRGRYQEKLGNHAAAWADWMAGKAITRERLQHRYDSAYYVKYFDQLREAGTAPRPNFHRRAPDLVTAPGPLFVCGFPRSGTTLTETILSSHSAIIAGDELNGLQDVIESLSAFCRVRVPYPAAMVATSLGENASVPELLRDLYMKAAHNRIAFVSKPRANPSGKVLPRKPAYFTDKMPLNEIHLPLLRMLFPTAPIFRMQRHPLDVMVSCMANWLPHGGFYAAGLESCALHYRRVDDLLQHYEKQFAIQDRRGYLSWRYEDVIENPAGTVGAMLTAAGLPMEKACTEPHKNKRTARTLSYRAVKQPLNSGAVGRWRHYRDQLAPAVEILRPILERENYAF